ncbi:MAG: hypothetical protein PUP93_29875 [Rhizonema sp. NSF051]|nr:hypothetical protein [Rhizonema sp. NSF051]
MLLHSLKKRCLKKLASAQALTSGMGSVAIATVLSCFASPADAVNLTFVPDDLVVSRSVYQGNANTVTVGQTLPGGGTATNNGLYPNVFNNEKVDASFGVTSPIFLDQITTSGQNAGTVSIDPTIITTSFPSKSELSLNLTGDGTGLTFMGYSTGINQLDVSNSNTPGIIEPGNPVTTTPTYRAVGQLNYDNSLQVTTTNAYPGNNGRAAILAPNGVYYTVGNGGNGNGSTAVTNATGVQIVNPGQKATSTTPTIPVGQYNITQNGYTADKTAKDNNFRGETIYNNTLYTTKGSGNNGINSVYQVGSAGTLPNPANAANTPISILPGFNTTLARNPLPGVQNNPFGLFFANPNTLYVTDEGNDATTTAGGIASTNVYGGLQKWSLVNGTWVQDYVLTNGLQLGSNYTAVDPVTGNTYNTATEGLRNLTGKVNSDGTVSLYAVTSTISNATDQGADPNKLVAITDNLLNTTAALAATEQFNVIDNAKYGEVLRGVSFAPSSKPVPEPVTILGSVIAMLRSCTYGINQE